MLRAALVCWANLTRTDAEEFLALAAKTRIRTHVVPFALSAANEALTQLRSGQLTGAAVLVPDALMPQRRGER